MSTMKLLADSRYFSFIIEARNKFVSSPRESSSKGDLNLAGLMRVARQAYSYGVSRLSSEAKNMNLITALSRVSRSPK